jgi:murein L,D-transpeptidase YafK
MRRFQLFICLVCIGIFLFPHLAKTLPKNTVADKIVVEKSQRRLRLYQDGKLFKSYRISLGTEPRGPKTQQGDHKTPEGKYFIDGKNPHSAFHLALHLSYPNAEDSARANELGVPPGGQIMIHGLPNGMGFLSGLQQYVDWTDGCIAVNNADIEEIYQAVPVGTMVEILP